LLWAECAVNDQLAALQGASLEAYGQRNERPFRPHVTLARIRGNGSTIARRCPIHRDLSLTQQIESVELFKSPPPGSRGYKVLASLRLGDLDGPDQIPCG
jgi:2'-5' RNA ligase